MKIRTILLMLAAISPAPAQEQASISQSLRQSDERTGLTAVAIELALPEAKYWRVEAPPPESGLDQAVFEMQSESFTAGTKPPAKMRTAVLALERRMAASPVRLTLHSIPPGRTVHAVWNPDKAKAEKPKEANKSDSPVYEAGPLARWAAQRALRWQTFGPPPSGSIADRWINSLTLVYGAFPLGKASGWRMEPVRGLDALAVFGGRCAVEETLQLNLIDERRELNAPKQGQPVRLKDLPALDVKSHPFADMVRGREVPPLPLAAFCPADRFFAWFPEPKRLRSLMDRMAEGSDRLAAAGGEAMIDYQLWTKVLARLGLEEKTVREWMEAGRAEELAVFAADLFLRDSTDLTFLIQLKDEGAAALLFKMVPETGAAVTVTTNGGQCHLARRGRVLIVSTSKAEAALALALADNKVPGAGSLGVSDEFRYMRWKLAATPETLAYLYFSDPFIRRLTGAEMKIGQFRRARDRSRLEDITAAALLYQLDHRKTVTDLPELLKSGYLLSPRRRGSGSKRLDADETRRMETGFSLHDGVIASSHAWGRLANLAPLSANRIDTVTPDEAALYKDYVERYKDYWRKYFDPIAIRVEQKAADTLGVSTFILPLVDNSLYNGLKAALSTARAVDLPQLNPPPAAIMALSMDEKAPDGMISELAPELRITGLKEAGLSGSVAVAFPDVDAVLQLGGVAGAGTGQMGSMVGGAGNMAGLTLLVAFITRPVDVFLGVEDEKKVLETLQQAAAMGPKDFFELRTVQRGGENRRLYALVLAGMAQIHMEVRITNGWLHLSNHPWSQPISITGTENVAGAAAVIRLHPEHLKAGGPAALFMAQNDHRRSIMAACSELLPWMDAPGVDAAGAQQRQRLVLGIQTPLPDGTVLTGGPEPSLEPWLKDYAEHQPAEKLQDDHGILRSIQSVELHTNFEEDGLRAELTWKTNP